MTPDEPTAMTASTPSSEGLAYLADRRPCGQCGHTTVEHWTEATGSFACTRSGCDCTSWFAAPALLGIDDRGDLGGGDLGGGGDLAEVDRPGWVGPPVVTLCGSMRFWPLMLASPPRRPRPGSSCWPRS